MLRLTSSGFYVNMFEASQLSFEVRVRVGAFIRVDGLVFGLAFGVWVRGLG